MSAGALASVATILFKGFFRKIGRKGVMMGGGAAFLAGALLQACARSMPMLIVGRLCLGVGIGFANQVCPSSPHCQCTEELYNVRGKQLLGRGWRCCRPCQSTSPR